MTDLAQVNRETERERLQRLYGRAVQSFGMRMLIVGTVAVPAFGMGGIVAGCLAADTATLQRVAYGMFLVIGGVAGVVGYRPFSRIFRIRCSRCGYRYGSQIQQATGLPYAGPTLHACPRCGLGLDSAPGEPPQESTPREAR